MNFRKGDVVSVRGTVEYDWDNDSKLLFIEVPGHHTSVALTPDYWDRAGLKLEQPYFEVGEAVCWEGGAGVILAIQEGHAWIGMGGGDYCTRMLESIQRVPTEGTADEA